MASLIIGVRCLQRLHVVQIGSSGQLRKMAGWSKDFKPSPYPENDTEREKSARKYNLLPEDYKVNPKSGYGYGDYPKVYEGLGRESRDPYYPYDFPELKRNYGELVSIDADMYSEDRWSQPDKPRYSRGIWWLSFLLVMGAFVGSFFFLQDYKMYRPVAAKQYPYKGVTHYTFEMEPIE